MFNVALNGALESASVGAIEDTTEGSPASVLRDLYKDAQESAFEVEIKDGFQVTIKLQLKMHMVVHLLVHKSAQNDPIKKVKFSRYSMLHLKAHLRFYSREHLNVH